MLPVNNSTVYCYMSCNRSSDIGCSLPFVEVDFSAEPQHTARLTSWCLVCRTRFVLHRDKEMQIGLTSEQKQALKGVGLDQLLAAFRTERFKFSSGKSAYRGVIYVKASRQFQTRISVAGKSMHLGYFSDEVQAAQAYDKAAMQHHGRCAL